MEPFFNQKANEIISFQKKIISYKKNNIVLLGKLWWVNREILG